MVRIQLGAPRTTKMIYTHPDPVTTVNYKEKTVTLESFFKLDNEAQEYILKSYRDQQRIKDSYNFAKFQIQEATNAIKEIQERCVHPAKVSVPRSDTGKWDRSQDEYWTEHTCPDCGKFWREYK